MGYSKSTVWSDCSASYDVFYGRSFDECGREEQNRLVLRKYHRRGYRDPIKWLDHVIEDCLKDVGGGKRILLHMTPGYYQEGDNYRFFVPFEKAVQKKIEKAIAKNPPASL